VGRKFIEYFASSNQAVTKFLSPSKKDFEYCQLADKLLILPLTFMNESGIAAKQATAYFKLKPEEIMLVHDDSDMTLGKYKIVYDQRSAGHKGVQSTIDYLKTQKFWRLKIGIRPAQEAIRQKAEKFVLKKISMKDESDLTLVFGQIISELKN
jgi:PTH1 family peptidyl-tRNA hydrolase